MASEKNFSIVRTLTLAIPLIIIAALIVEWTEIRTHTPTSELVVALGEDSSSAHIPIIPSAIVLGIFFPVVLLFATLRLLRRWCAVTRGELVVVFCLLCVAAPIMGAGFWQQFAGLQLEYGRTRQLTRAMSISPNLWPNHGNLLKGASAEDAPLPAVSWTFPEEATIADSPDGQGKCLKIIHHGDEQVSQIRLKLQKSGARRFLKAMRRYAVCARLRLDEPGPQAQARMMVGPNLNSLLDITSAASSSEPGLLEREPRLLAPHRFVVMGQIDYLVPRTLEDFFYVELTFSGRGILYVRDFTIIDTEELYRYFEGYEVASPEVFNNLSEAERNQVILEPSGFWNRLYHLLFGRVPWRAWARPLGVWSLFVVGSIHGHEASCQSRSQDQRTQY